MSNTRIDNRMANISYGHSNSNVGNVSNITNSTINVGIEEELGHEVCNVRIVLDDQDARGHVLSF